MPLLPLGGTNGEMTWGVECHLRHWRAHTVGDVGRDMQSSPLDSTHGGTPLGMPSHHRHLTIYTVGLRHACHAIMAFVNDTRSDDVGHGNAVIFLGMYTWSDDVRRGMSSSPYYSTHNRTTLGMA